MFHEYGHAAMSKVGKGHNTEEHAWAVELLAIAAFIKKSEDLSAKAAEFVKARKANQMYNKFGSYEDEDKEAYQEISGG